MGPELCHPDSQRVQKLKYCNWNIILCIFHALDILNYIYFQQIAHKPIPVAARSKAWVCGRSLAGIAGSNPVGGMVVFVSCGCWLLLGRDICDVPIPRPEEPQ